jgi:5-methylcytosine-specific restriction endonuclease McrA
MKRRCSVCREYFPKEGMLVSSGVTAVCSQACLQESGRTARAKQSKGRSNRKHSLDADTNDRSLVRGRSTRRSSPKEGVSAETAERVFARDAKRCRSCGGVAWLHLHHIVYRSQGGAHDETNLITLCEDCHLMVHSSKRKWQPLLVEVLRLGYQDSKKVTVLELARHYLAAGRDDK